MTSKLDRIIELLERVVENRNGLPPGKTIDDVISFPSQAAKWLGLPEDWVKSHQSNLPGVIVESQRVKLFHPRTYLNRRLRLK